MKPPPSGAAAAVVGKTKKGVRWKCKKTNAKAKKRICTEQPVSPMMLVLNRP